VAGTKRKSTSASTCTSGAAASTKKTKKSDSRKRKKTTEKKSPKASPLGLSQEVDELQSTNQAGNAATVSATAGASRMANNDVCTNKDETVTRKQDPILSVDRENADDDGTSNNDDNKKRKLSFERAAKRNAHVAAASALDQESSFNNAGKDQTDKKDKHKAPVANDKMSHW
jgi:hypothetical protein